MKYLVLLLFTLSLFKTNSANESPKIIIIGSGPSGIAAASRLLENGFVDITILEAENRYGGRLNKTQIGPYVVDMGGQWVHGSLKNVAYNLASPLNLITAGINPTETEEPEYDLKFFESSGDRVAPEKMKELIDFAMPIEREEPTIIASSVDSLGEYIEKRCEEFFNKHPEYSAEFQKAFLDSFELVVMAMESAEDWHELSLKSYLDYRNRTGNNDYNWKERTYTTILEILMKRFPNPEEELPVLNKTIFNKKVSKISYGGEGPVKVTTRDGSEYTADHVIFTPSLGVLKAEHEKIFDPPLPEKKREAIQKLGYGKHGKVFIYFDEPWWGEKTMNHFLWSKEDREEIKNDPEKSWLLSVTYDGAVEYKPKLYYLWLTGTYTEGMEKLSVEVLKNQTMWFLQKFLGKNYNITTPGEFVKTSWITNENFYGTYSYIPVDAFKNGIGPSALAEPIMQQSKPILQFAGEATHPERYALVNGAIETGWREADRIIDFYKNK